MESMICNILQIQKFIAVFAGLGLMGFGYFQYSGSVARGWPYAYSHLELIIGR